MSVAFISGEHVYLRPIEEQDLLGDYPNWFNDPEVTAHMIRGSYPNTLVQQKRFYEEICFNKENLQLAIVQKSTDKMIGVTGLHRIEPMHQCAEFAIVIGDKSAWGSGYGSEATRLICSHGFLSLNLNRIELGVFASHERAIRSYSKIGFAEEGVLKKRYFKKGKFVDVVLMAWMREDFLKTLNDD